MKSYPSIPRHFQEFDAYLFDKLDGSNLRWEWSRKSSWYKQGTRNCLFDETDAVFGKAIPLFKASLATPLEKLFRDKRWDKVVVFTEFWGTNSFAGVHDPADTINLTVFDVSVHQKGLIAPSSFLDLFADVVPTPAFLGRQRWTRGLLEQIKAGDFPGVTFEGVVGKGGSGHELVMRKAKTQAWLDKVVAKLGPVEGAKLAES